MNVGCFCGGGGVDNDSWAVCVDGSGDEEMWMEN